MISTSGAANRLTLPRRLVFIGLCRLLRLHSIHGETIIVTPERKKSSESRHAVNLHVLNHAVIVAMPLMPVCCFHIGLGRLRLLHENSAQTSSLDVQADQLEARIESLPLSVTSAYIRVN